MKLCSLLMAVPWLFCIASPLLGATAGSRGLPPAGSFAQVTIQQTLIIRVPNRRAPPAPLRWKLKKGPKCVEMASIAGAAIDTDDAIDLVLRGGDRLRAQFAASCPALDYYSGFYMLPTEDGRICADRDMIRTRSGGQCEIRRFRKLTPIGSENGE